jgi:signal transduction histidine kinase
MWRVVRSGRPELLPTVPEAVLERAARDSEHLALLRGLGLTSALWLPLAARGRVLGALGLFTAESRRRLGLDDQVLAEEVAVRASLAIDNAALFAAERTARAQAEEAVRTRDEFLSIASHELRNPVAGLSGTAQLLRRAERRGRLDPEQLDRYLERIERVAAHLAELTEDLLDVSRLRGGTLPLRPKLTDLAQEAVGRAETRATGHTFQVALARQPWPVLLDPDRVEQIITNLLDNAMKYSPPDRAVQVSLEPANLGVLLCVADQGIGLPAGTQDSIFEPFGRAPNAAARNVPDLGLGLYISRRLAEQHGGRLWAESPGEDQGTVLRLWLPEAASPPDHLPGA